MFHQIHKAPSTLTPEQLKKGSLVIGWQRGAPSSPELQSLPGPRVAYRGKIHPPPRWAPETMGKWVITRSEI